MPRVVAEAEGGGDGLPAAGLRSAHPDATQAHVGEVEIAEERARKLVVCINASSWFPALDEEWPRHCAQAAAMGLELRLLDAELMAEASGGTVRMAELIEAGAGKVVGLVDFRTYDARLWLPDEVAADPRRPAPAQA